MKINGLKEMKNKIDRLRVITPTPPSRWRAVWASARLTLIRTLFVVGVLTTLSGLCLYFLSPKAESRGAKIKQLQQDLRTGKINAEQFKTGFEEAIKK